MAAPGYINKLLSGWGRYPSATGKVYRPEDLSSALTVVRMPEKTPVLGRGLAKSYGDASFIQAGRHILTTRLNRFLEFDETSGRLTCESGVTFEDLINTFLPRGWFPPVTPGTKLVTLGGALASDIHGKNHHTDGSISNFVDSFRILLSSGEIVTSSREERADLFYATLGGMGLSGLILDITLRLLPVETGYINMRKIKCRQLDETIEIMNATEHEFRYSVCWIDCLAQGNNLGRSVIILGNHAKRSDLPSHLSSDPLPIKHGTRLVIPFDMPEWTLNGTTIGAFNEVYYGLSSSRNSTVGYDSFFYPLDSIKDWNRLYGKAGFIQYQLVIPEESGAAGLREILTYTTQHGLGSFLAVLKRMKNEPAPLAFPLSGYTLTLDIPVRRATLESLKELDRIVIDLGGRVYLAKDAILSPENFRKMYQRYPEWLVTKKLYDSENLFRSSLAERLKLFED